MYNDDVDSPKTDIKKLATRNFRAIITFITEQ